MLNLRKKYQKQRACVLGAGVSGIAAARLLSAQGGEVTLLDAAPEARLGRARKALAGSNIKLLGNIAKLPDTPFTLAVASPSIVLEHPWLRACRARNIPVTGEMELGHAFWPGRILAVTGSKGKSSVVKLCAETLTLAGYQAVPAGNYGLPLSACVLDHADATWAVVEVSSFQLELVERFRPEIAILLNIQADHLDRHGTMETYTRLKYRLFARQRAGDLALLPVALAKTASQLPSEVTVQTFGQGKGNWFFRPGSIQSSNSENAITINFGGTWFDNPILGEGAAAAVAALTACGLNQQEIEAGFAAFRPLPHRMQRIASDHGVVFINDSKATTLAAMGAALEMTPEPVRLIAGGQLKEHDLDTIKELLVKRVKKVYLIGDSSCLLQEAWSTAIDCVVCSDLKRAVQHAAREANPGEAVLLSPGCASFDQYRDFKQRGEDFVRQVQAVKITS